MILWWGKKKKAEGVATDPATPEQPSKIESPSDPLGLEDVAARLAAENGEVATPQPASVDVDPDDPIGLKKAAEKIERRKAEEAARREAALLNRLSEGLKRTSSRLGDGLASAFSSRRLDQDALEELEDLLIMSDMGGAVASRITSSISRSRMDKEVGADDIRAAIAEEITQILKPREEIVDFAEGPSPRVVLFVGVNGSGKTTTIGKIACKLSAQGANILMAAGDTFRAAAVEQLKVWSERANAAFLSRPNGADASGLAYDAVHTAKKNGHDLVLIDTAGRLQNKAELMDELAKVVRAIRKIDPTAPHDVLLVLDATVGQNALSQVEAFRHTAGVTGLVMTKLDGTAKGGVLVAIAEKYEIPIHFVGIGEKAEDLHPFSASTFARALVGLGPAGA